jgi:hypothetical protein
LLLNLFRLRTQLLLENALFRQQLIICQRSVKRPKLLPQDRILLVWLSRVFAKWKESLVVVRPETVIGWHRKGIKFYWRWKSRRAGRPAIDWSLIKLIRKLKKENSLWLLLSRQLSGLVVRSIVAQNSLWSNFSKPANLLFQQVDII